MWDSIHIERNEFTVDHAVTLNAFDSFRDFGITVADNLAIAAVEGDLAAFDLRDHETRRICLRRSICHHRRVYLSAWQASAGGVSVRWTSGPCLCIPSKYVAERDRIAKAFTARAGITPTA